MEQFRGPEQFQKTENDFRKIETRVSPNKVQGQGAVALNSRISVFYFKEKILSLKDFISINKFDGLVNIELKAEECTFANPNCQ